MKVNTLLRMYEAGTQDFAGVDLAGASLREVDLTDANLTHVRWHDENWDGFVLA